MPLKQLGTGQERKNSIGRVLYLVFFLAVIVAGFQTATQVFAKEMAYHEALGPSIYGWYAPWKILFWAMNWYEKAPETFDYCGSYGVIVVTLGFGVLLGTKYVENTRLKKNHTLHGSARWATEKDIEDAGIMQSTGVYVGAMYIKEKGKKVLKYLIHNGAEHILTYAPTRSGKGVGLVIPSLLTWTHSAVITDLKGELWAITSGWREKFADNICLKYEPASPDSVKWNPLDEVRLFDIEKIEVLDENGEHLSDENGLLYTYIETESEFTTGDAQNLATVLVDPDGEGIDDHWKKTALALLTGCILHLCYKQHREGREAAPATLSALDAMLANPSRPISELWEEMISYPHFGPKGTSPAVAMAAQDMKDRPDNEAGSVLSTAKSALSLYRDPIVAKNTGFSSFSIRELMNSDKPISLYIVTQPSDKERLKPLVRVLITMLVRIQTNSMEFVEGKEIKYTKLEKLYRKLTRKSTYEGKGAVSAKGKYKWRQLFMIDEFPSLGRLDILQEALSYMAGYGIKAYLICQDITQLRSREKGYGDQETVSSNCHIQNAYPPTRYETAQYLSNMTGTTTVVKEQISQSGKRFGSMGQVTKSIQEVQRPLLTPDEAMRMRGPKKDANGMIVEAGTMLVFVAGFPAILGEQPLYFAIDKFIARSALPPAQNKPLWEFETLVKQDAEIVKWRNKYNEELPLRVFEALEVIATVRDPKTGVYTPQDKDTTTVEKGYHNNVSLAWEDRAA